MAGTLEDTDSDGSTVVALLHALRQDSVQHALDTLEAETGLARERIIADAVLFADRNRASFLAQLRGRPPRSHSISAQPSRLRRFVGENGMELVVAGMFLLGAALAAIQIMLLN
jgi:hypothetical protein